VTTEIDSARNSNSSQIQIKPKSQFEFVPRDTEDSASEFFDLVDFRGAAFLVDSETVRVM